MRKTGFQIEVPDLIQLITEDRLRHASGPVHRPPPLHTCCLKLFEAKTLFNRLWPLLDLRAVFDLRSTKCFLVGLSRASKACRVMGPFYGSFVSPLLGKPQIIFRHPLEKFLQTPITRFLSCHVILTLLCWFMVRNISHEQLCMVEWYRTAFLFYYKLHCIHSLSHSFSYCHFSLLVLYNTLFMCLLPICYSFCQSFYLISLLSLLSLLSLSLSYTHTHNFSLTHGWIPHDHLYCVL